LTLIPQKIMRQALLNYFSDSSEESDSWEFYENDPYHHCHFELPAQPPFKLELPATEFLNNPQFLKPTPKDVPGSLPALINTMPLPIDWMANATKTQPAFTPELHSSEESPNDMERNTRVMASLSESDEEDLSWRKSKEIRIPVSPI
jgi:hypothetical protein